MKKYMAFAAAFLLAATLMTACDRGMVSDDPGGRITDPTGQAESVNPMPTMTIPPTILPEPTASDSTRPSSMPDNPF